MNKNQEKKEIFGIKPSDINKIEIDKTKFDIDYELKLVDSKGSGITKFAEINDNKAIKAELKIILSNKNHNARDNDQPEQVVYHLQNTDFKINEGKIIVDKSNQKNLENKLKKAYQKLIQENPKTVATLVTDTDDVYFTFTENASEITINLQRDLTKNTQRVITANNISIELIWHTTRAISLEDTMKDLRQIIISSPQEDSFWKKNKKQMITIFILITMLTLIIIFWKKIRSWFKWGKKDKTNQEKLEIF